MPKARIVVTGMGIYSSLGKGVTANHTALRSNTHGLGDITVLKTRHSGHLPSGEIKATNEELTAHTRFDQGAMIPRSVLLSIPAIEEALGSAVIDPADTMISFYYATTVGGIDISEELILQRSLGRTIDYAGFRYHDCGAGTRLLADYFNFRGRLHTISTACSSSANAIGRACSDLRNGTASYAVAGGADALCRFTINGFNALMILDKKFCTPMDENRQGLNLGEAAAYLVLETEENAMRRGAKILAYVSGYGNTNDSYHQTASSDDGIGAMMAILTALDDAGLMPEHISYINAHGTGTQNNDFSEGNAIAAVFEKIPPVASTKSFTGHTLAASGSVEAVFSVLAILHQEVYPTLRFKDPITGSRFRTFSRTYPAEVDHVLSNAFGFGGNCSALIFSKKS